MADPEFLRKNTKDNTPAVIFTEIVPGNTVDVTVAAKGGGRENKSKMYMLNPGDSVVDWVLKTVPTMGAGWCPPGMLGIGIGGTAEKAVLMAKESLMDDLDMYELQAKQASGAELDNVEKLRLELFEKVNALGIGAQGLGGLTTVLDVKIKMYPTHAASKPDCHDPELRRHPPRPLCDGRQRPGLPDPAIAGPVAQRQLDTRLPSRAKRST